MQKYIAPFFICISLLLLPLVTTGQKFEFTHYFTHNGLSQSTISAIEQDYQGFLWFGTFNGLNRFDGYSFKVYKKDPTDDGSLTSSHIEAVYEDRNKNLWVGTADGVNRYKREFDSFEYYRYENPGPSDYAVHSFAEDNHGRLWVGGWQGLCYVDSISKTLTKVLPADTSSDIPKTVFDIEVDLAGEKLWLATEQGLYLYDIRKNEFLRISFPDEQIASLSTEAKALCRDRNGVLWLGTKNGVYQMLPDSYELTGVLPSLDDELINDITVDKTGKILIATEHGLFTYNNNTGELKQYKKERSLNALSDNVVRKIYFDRNDHLWLGTFYGLNYNGSNQNFTTLGKAALDKPGLINPYVTTLYSAGNEEVFVGTAEGVEVIKVKSNDVDIVSDRYPGLSAIQKAVISITSDSAETIFISTWPLGFYQYDKKTNSVDALHEKAGFPTCGLPVILFHEGYLWIGCENNLFQYDPTNAKVIKRISFERGNIGYITRDSKNNLLCGGQSGMMSYNIDTEEIIYYKHDDPGQSLHAKAVNYIYEDGDRNYWIATHQGLFLMDKQQKLTSFWKKSGFGDDDVRSITEDDNHNLWISTTDKLYRYSRRNDHVKRFDMSDGMLVSEFSESAAVETGSGSMVFGGKHGLIVFHPDSIHDDSVAPKVVITNFKILNRPISVGSEVLPKHISISCELTVDYTAKEFSFEFVGINFSSPGKSQYAYIMEGFDNDWNYSGTRRFASYTNLPAGREYTFRVKASNEDGVWSEQPTALKVYITPPFWDTWWFKVLTYATVCAAIFGVYRIRTNNIRQQQLQLQKQKILLEEEVRTKTADIIAANQKLQEQAERITHMNALLKQDNIKLEHDVKDLVEARVMQKVVSFNEFRLIYPDNEACFRFIDELKSIKEFHCKKCNYHKFSKGHDYSRRCSKCNYVETIITGTIFAGIKFPISKAFYLLYLMTDGKHYTLGDLSELVDLRQQTCWTFKKRVEERANILTHRNKDGWSHLITISDLAHQKD